MIISKIRLFPFAGLHETELSFSDGMNVILGPNEAGKSTVFHSIESVLFTPANLTKTRLTKEMGRFLPVGGGDTIRAELHFAYNENYYTLRRQWGSKGSSDLRLPDGNIISDERAIAKEIGSFLGASPGTYKSVLMTCQTGLSATLDELKKKENSETILRLGDILRKAVLNTDGVSIDEFTGKVQNLYDDYTRRWDWKRQYPQNGRGIENPYKVGLGNIAKSFYAKEAISVSFEKACHFESELDKLNREIAELEARCSEKEQFIEENKKLITDAHNRNFLNAKLEALEREIDEYKRANKEWPVLEHKVQDIRSQLPALRERHETLNKERAEAESAEVNKSVFDRWERVKARKALADDAEKRFQSVKKLIQEEFDEISAAFSRFNQLETQLSASRLSVKFSAKADVMLSVKKDVETETREQIRQNETHTYNASGRLNLEHPEWCMEIISGDVEFSEIEKNFSDAQSYLDDILKKHRIESEAQAKEINRKYEECMQEVKHARENLILELGDISFEELETIIGEIGDIVKTRPIVDVVADVINAENELMNKNEEMEYCQEKITVLKSRFRDNDELLLKLAEAVRRQKIIREDIDQLGPLPDGIADLNAFTDRYERMQKELADDNKARKELEIQRAGMEARMPDQSSEELEKQLKEHEEAYERVLRRGKAIARIRDLTLSLTENIDTDTYSGLRKHLETYISAMTDNRYSQIQMAESLPAGFIRNDGNLIGSEILSTGTKDVLGLALRLSMGDYFLKESSSFLLMDDPLVDMDPARQANAAEVLREYANKRQLIIFTCHPLNAALLGGDTNPILLPSDC